ncbi:hypothetical protein TWF481_001679 [Arthrobotrys musiformis]|uniref:F-box domain-containing protein n=1 Tax=Arthrobotrys musiformis TaxID=47236 RepID=A0AAV9VVT5_9PEZI
MNRESQEELFPVPPELHVEILKYLSAAEIMGVIQGFNDIRGELSSWNLTFLDAEQLVSMLEHLRDKTSKLHTYPGAANLEKKIFKALPGALQKYVTEIRDSKQRQAPKLRPTLFNCYFNEIRKITNGGKLKPSHEVVTEFLRIFNKRNDIVRTFCDRVAKVDPHGKIFRPSNRNIKPDEKTWFECLLFWIATDYIREQCETAGHVNGQIIFGHWNSFLDEAGAIFGEATQYSLGNCLQVNEIFCKYRGYVGEFGKSHLSKIADCVNRRQDRYRNAEDTYPTFILQQGLGHADKFLLEDDEAIKLIGPLVSQHQIRIWKKVGIEDQSENYYDVAA